jgi:hypothetical protein
MAPTKDPVIEKRKAEIKNTHRCPYCERDLEMVDVSGNAMGDWGAPTLYVCFNDGCSYYERSRQVLEAQGIDGGAYRLAWEPEKDWCGPITASGGQNPRGAPVVKG